jgi:predicted KAP-like P-loop ATPase
VEGVSDLPLVPNLSSDRPISSLTEDALGRGGFAVALANAFIQWHGEDSLVVALYGPWGSGKSSLKNMILEMIRRHVDRPAIVEFNPWAWSGRDRLFSAFFDEVGIAIGKGSDTKEAKALASRWRKYGARLSFAGTAIAAIKNGTQALGIPLVPLILEGVSSGAKQASELAEGAAKAHEAASEEEPLDELKRSLSESLGGLKAPLMVVMDDVDRLTKEEVRLLFQLIKVNADFPRVVYFLLFDRGVIEKALDGEGGSSGRDYMEKIVQAGFDLPKHDQADLDNMLCQGLNRLLNFQGAERTFDMDRWGKLHHYGLRPMLGTPRDVNRFLSSISFTIGLFFRERTLEVNIIDLIGIEVLRLFEPDLYHQLPEKRELLFGSGSAYLSGRDDREGRKQRVEKFIEQAGEPHRDAVRAILRELFPSIDWLLMGHGEGQGFESGWMRSLRICHKDLFDRYFALAVPKGDLPVSVIDRIISVLKEREEIRRELTALGEGGRLVEALNRLAAYTSELDMDGAAPFITALMDVGDSLPDRGSGMFSIGPDITAYFVIYNFLKREGDAGARSRILLEALSATDGLYLPIQVVSLDENRRGKKDAYDPPLLDDRSWARARKICLAKLKQGAADGRLLSSKLGTYLWRWKGFSDDEALRKFVTTLTSTPNGSLHFLRALAGEVRSQSMGSVTVHAVTRIDLKAIEHFMPVAKIKSKLGPLLGGEIPHELAALAAEYQKELLAFRATLDPGHRDQFDPDASVVAQIDLNSATPDDLAGLPGIDTELARRIVERRPFDKVEDIKSVRGIGDKRFSRIRGLISVVRS